MTPVPTACRAKKLAIHIGSGAPRRVGAMLQRQNLSHLTASQRDFPAGSIGCLGDVVLPAQGNIRFFTGLPIHGADVENIVDADSAERLFPSYDGAFTGVLWDAQRNTLVIVTDCLGMQPLYMRHANGELTLATETKAMGGDPDPAAWGAFISIGHPIGERSLLNGVRRVPPASVLTYDCTDHRLTIRRHWQWPDPSDTWRSHDFLASLERDLHAYAAFGHAGTVLLSGGFDSRLLLFLLQRARIPVDALIVAHEDEYDDADGRLAEAVAGMVGVPFRKVQPPPDFFSSRAYLDYLNASDAAFPSLDLFISKVASQIGSDAVWDGLAPGFLFMPLHQPEGGFRAYLQQEIRGTDSAIWRAARELFRPGIAETMLEGFSQDMRAEMGRLPQDAYGLARFVIENRSRNRPAMNPLKVFANRADAFTPGLSRDFLAHALVIPFQEKQHAGFYRRLFANLDKRALTVPFLSGGELLQVTSASVVYQRERILIEWLRFRAQHPGWFGHRRNFQARHSAFLGEHLSEGGDAWLAPHAHDKLKSLDGSNYLMWKLLFHWKAWQWVHEGRPEMLRGTRQC